VKSNILRDRTFTLSIARDTSRPTNGDRVVLFDGFDQDIRFTHSGIVDRAYTQSVSGEDQVVITLARVEPFDVPRDLVTLSGSLVLVGQFLTPWDHFTNEVTEIPEMDFITIENDRRAVARSVFWYLYSTFPPRLKVTFVQRHFSRLGLTEQFQITAYEQPAREIVRFLREVVEPPIRLTNDIGSVYEKMSNRPNAADSNLPPVHALRLGGDLEADDISFGQLIPSVQKFLNTSILFRPNPDNEGKTLLDECEHQLESDVQGDFGSGKWTETIF